MTAWFGLEIGVVEAAVHFHERQRQKDLFFPRKNKSQLKNCRHVTKCAEQT